MEEMRESLESLEATVSRLALTASSLEETVGNLEQRLEAQQAEMSGRVERMVAAVDSSASPTVAGPLEERLAEVERQIAELQAGAQVQAAQGHAGQGQGRRTLPASTANLLAKHGVSDAGPVESGALDAALVSLPVEQRIAVKSQLLRAGLLG
jgi:phage shock protein A